MGLGKMPSNKQKEGKPSALMAVFVSSFTTEPVSSNFKADQRSAVMLLPQQLIEWQHLLDITWNGASDAQTKCCISQRTLKPFLY